MWEPLNDLERAFRDAHLGSAETVAYFRELRESILLFIMPYSPGMEGVSSFGNGSTMTFLTWTVGGEVVIPVFTSSARAEEALQAAGKWQEKNGLGEMLGKELLHVISMTPGHCKVVVNPGCASGSRTMDEKMVLSIVDESALYLPTPGELALNGLVMSLPKSFSQPERLRGPLGKFFSGLPEVKAAWLFYEENPAKPFERVFVLGMIVEGGDAEELRREAALAIQGACPPEWNSRAWLMDPKDDGLKDVIASVPPFYAAPDFKPPVA